LWQVVLSLSRLLKTSENQHKGKAMNKRVISVLLTVFLTTGVFCSPAASQVVLSEDFESGSLGKDWERYKEDSIRGGFETRSEYVHSGKKSYRITTLAYTGEEKIIRGHTYKESDSWLRVWFLPVCDLTYIRWYAKFAEDFDQGKGMHWCQFWGCNPDNPRSVLGGAGQRPTGTDRFITNIEPQPLVGVPPPGQIRFYTYWPDMQQSADGYYWGNFFYPPRPYMIERGKWYCFEVMVKTNEPGKKDGEQAFWINGEKIMHIKEFRWRDVESLKLNMVIFGLYIGYCEKDCTYWIDDIVISTDYVGPMKSNPEGR